ncbi:MAG: YbaK/prolyl-tRNA synthetase associated domain-containing protein [Variovorax sp.]
MPDTTSVFELLCERLTSADARFRVVEHGAEGRSDSVAALRGTEPGQGAKAMLCTFKDAPSRWVLAVLPGNCRIDFKKVAAACGQKKATLVAPAVATALTGCVVGAIAPFVLSGEIELLVDPALTESHDEIAFNAGRLDRSIVLNSADYLRIAKPRLGDISSSA